MGHPREQKFHIALAGVLCKPIAYRNKHSAYGEFLNPRIAAVSKFPYAPPEKKPGDGG